MARRSWFKLAAAPAAILFAAATAYAAETITYTYDARGRLVKAEHSGSVNDNLKAEYSYDRADNRTNVKVTGASGTQPSARIVVVPLGGGYKVIVVR